MVKERPDQPESDATLAPETEAPAALVPWPVVWLVLLGGVFFSIWWVQQTEITVNTGAISESTPPVPAIALLLVFWLMSAGMAKACGRPLFSRAHLMTLWVGLCFASFMPGHGVVKRLMPAMGVPGYFQTPENGFEKLLPHIPAWLAPKDPQVLQDMYEGVETGAVPWDAWIGPLAAWALVLALLFLGIQCLVALFQHRWSESERLTYPMLAVPLELIGAARPKGAKHLLADPVFWIGVGVAALYNTSNILHAFNPNVTCVPPRTVLDSLFQGRPWDAISPFQIDVRLELLGLGYLVNTDVSLTYWVTSLLLRLESVMLAAAGYEQPGAPHSMSQAAGAYLVLAVGLIWGARSSLGRQIRSAFTREADSSDAWGNRWRVLGLAVGWVGALAWLIAAGMNARVAIVFLALIAAFALVYARVRAETGMPNIWTFPMNQPTRLPISFFGSNWVGATGPASATALAVAGWLGQGYFLSCGGMQSETARLTRDGHLSRRAAMAAMWGGMAVGLVVSYWAFLSPFYHFGANVLEGGVNRGGYTTGVAIGGYTEAVRWLDTEKPVAPDKGQSVAAIAGAVQAGALIVLRSRLVRLPLSPLAFGMACILGDRYWAMFLLTWAIKRAALWLGGVSLYRRMIPAFLGIAIGHFIIAGVIWGVLGRIYPHVSVYYFVGYG